MDLFGIPFLNLGIFRLFFDKVGSPIQRGLIHNCTSCLAKLQGRRSVKKLMGKSLYDGHNLPPLENRVDLFDKNGFGSGNTCKQIMIMYDI